MFSAWKALLRRIIRRNEEVELDEELQFHLERQTQENLAQGMESEEARRQARIAFGAMGRARDECRESRPGFWVERLFQDVRYALRGFRRNPVFALTIVATLMLGIGTTTAVFSVVDRILFRSLPYEHADQLVSVGMVHSLETQGFLMGNTYYIWRDNQKPFEEITSEATGPHECDLTEGTPVQLDCEPVEGNFLSTLGITPVLGRNFLPEEARPGGPDVALISYRLWLTHYNLDPKILNKTIQIDGKPVRVIGVLPQSFEMPRLQNVDVLRAIMIDEVADHSANGGYGSPRRVFARLKPGVSLEQAWSAMEPLFHDANKQIPADIRKDIHLSVRSLRDIQTQNVRLMAWVLFGSVISVLLIACANVASLLMARGTSRQRELAVRVALGASKARLFWQTLTETMLLSIAGAVAGYLFAKGLLRLFLALAPARLSFVHKAQLDLRVIGFTLAVSMLCGIFSGLIPALQRPNAELLTGRAEKRMTHASVRQLLVAGQIAAGMILLTVAMLLVRSFRNLDHQQMGIRVDNTVTARVTLGVHKYPELAGQAHFSEAVEDQLRYGPGVSAVAVTDSLPPAPNQNGGRLNQVVVAGKPPVTAGAGEVITSRWVSPGYFPTLEIPILQGRGFSQDEVTSSERPVILNQILAERLFPGQSPLGERMRFGKLDPDSPWYTVIGIAGNVRNSGLTDKTVPEYYLLRRYGSDHWDTHGVWSRTVIFVVRSSAPIETTVQWVHSRITAVDPTLPIDIATMKERVSSLEDQPRFQTVLVSLFAITGLAMAIIGLYGLLSFLVAQREREIGVRMALGATRSNILRLVMGRSLRLIASGTLVGLALSLMVSRMLSHLLFSVGPYDPLSYSLVILLLIFVGLMATLIPARSAISVDPAVTLRSE
ncbi:ABC transporter permease [Edaphobacter sp. 4G125]|nr:ABC transporter permease [Edaphobacter sp. 4G125]